MKKTAPQRIGVISDTHGLLRPEAIAALRGVDRIIHAGDIGGAAIIDDLNSVAPVSVVRGNNDADSWGDSLPESITLTLSGQRVFVLHNLAELTLDLEREKIHVVISGHSHKPSVSQQGKVLFVNPGSAGPRRFNLPTTLAHLIVGPDILRAEIIPLAIASNGDRSKRKARRTR